MIQNIHPDSIQCTAKHAEDTPRQIISRQHAKAQVKPNQSI